MLLCYRRLYYVTLLCGVVLIQELMGGGRGDKFDFIFFLTVIFYRFNETPGRTEEDGRIA